MRGNTTMKKPTTDHLGNKYPSVKKMCEAYKINEKTFFSRTTRDGYCLEEALGVMPRINNSTIELVVDNNLTIIRSVKANINGYYECMLGGRETILHHDDIIDYFRKNIFNKAT